VDSVGRNHIHLIISYPRGDRSRSLRPTADSILGIAIGRVTITFVHARLIVYRPRNVWEFIEKVTLNREVSLKSCISMITIYDVNVARRQGLDWNAMQVIPDGVADHSSSDPAVRNCEVRNQLQQDHDVGLARKERRDVFATAHVRDITRHAQAAEARK
jgi:hypothetical protein